MCKVMIMGGVKKENVGNAWRFVKAMGPLMSKSNTDGIGYTAVDSKGDMFGQRWWFNNQFLKRAGIVKESPDILKQYDEFLSETTSYGYQNYNPVESVNSFGKINYGDMVAITLHTRMATSGKGFENTHPFVYPEQDTSLIHNGIIQNVKDFDLKVSSCDSEAILISYLKNEVNLNPDNILKLASELQGYFMCGVFSRDAQGNRILDLFKHSANLHAAYVKELDTVVFSTSDDDIKTACEELGFSLTKPKNVKQDIFMRMDPLTGKLLEKNAWVYPEKKSLPPPMNTGTDSDSAGGTKKGWLGMHRGHTEPGSMSAEMFSYMKLETTLYHYTEIEQNMMLKKLGFEVMNG